jgi:hypothetical protein
VKLVPFLKKFYSSFKCFIYKPVLGGNFMKTIVYNPSTLEVKFAKAFESLIKNIEEKIKPNKIVRVDKRLKDDNPKVIFKIEDNEGDNHEIVIQIIQRMDDEEDF